MSDQSIVEVTDKRTSVTPADREAWIEYEDYDGAFADRIRTGSEDNTSGLQMFARYAEDARIAEREACAMVAEEAEASCDRATEAADTTELKDKRSFGSDVASDIAAAIRARS